MNEIHGGGEECDSHSASLRQLRRAECCNVQSVGEWTQLCDLLCRQGQSSGFILRCIMEEEELETSLVEIYIVAQKM